MKKGLILAGRYALQQELGQGLFGDAYLAHDESTGLTVTVKTLAERVRRDDRILADIKRNFQLLQNLDHPHIVKMHALEFDALTQEHFLVREYVSGMTLTEHRIRNGGGRLPLAEALELCRQIALALDHAHRSLLHRDLKPDNILITPAGEVKLINFCLIPEPLAKEIRFENMVRDLESASRMHGYMAPEQFFGFPPPGPAADRYALAAIFHELISGRSPFDQPEPQALMHAVCNMAPPLLKEVGKRRNRLVQLAMSKDPGKRFPSAISFIESLEASPLALMGHYAGPLLVALLVVVVTAGLGWYYRGHVGVDGLMTAMPGISAEVTAPSSRSDSLRSVAPREDGEAVATVEQGQTVMLRVESRPGGARVTLDGKQLGTTPLTVGQVIRGRYALRLEKQGYNDVVVDMELAEDTVVDLSLDEILPEETVAAARGGKAAKEGVSGKDSTTGDGVRDQVALPLRPAQESAAMELAGNGAALSEKGGSGAGAGVKEPTAVEDSPVDRSGLSREQGVSTDGSTVAEGSDGGVSGAMKVDSRPESAAVGKNGIDSGESPARVGEGDPEGVNDREAERVVLPGIPETTATEAIHAAIWGTEVVRVAGVDGPVSIPEPPPLARRSGSSAVEPSMADDRGSSSEPFLEGDSRVRGQGEPGPVPAPKRVLAAGADGQPLAAAGKVADGDGGVSRMEGVSLAEAMGEGIPFRDGKGDEMLPSRGAVPSKIGGDGDSQAAVLPDDPRILGWLKEAARHFRAMRLTFPQGENALERYDAVLALVPDHKAALEGKQKIADRLLSLAEEDIEEDRLSQPEGRNALSRIAVARRIDPENAKSLLLLKAVGEKYVALARQAARRSDRPIVEARLAQAAELAPESTLVAEAYRDLLQREWVPQPGPALAGSANPSATGVNTEHDPVPATTEKPVAIAAIPLSPAPGSTGQPPSAAKATWQDPVTGMEFIEISDGCFNMGNEDGDADESPVHKVCLDRYRISRLEVTQGVWKKVMGANNNPSRFSQDDQLPVDSVSWLMAMEFIQRLNEKSSVMFRLPTEAEWENACRAGGTDPYQFGSVIRTTQANFNGSQPLPGEETGSFRRTTTLVGSFPSNRFGLHDMHGNVYEWVEDWYVKDYYQKSPQRNPLASDDSSSLHVLRGGAWHSNSGNLRCGYRYRGRPDFNNFGNGFRLASSVTGGG
ncbi:MAG: SUMF1/EgtB/PvdO family nonheme iron enzyme [Magnetococcales bacterium]|nr:SUMF1/EgtB/PvdO family nonheme iron enzyme [Magnetococcales bacterium]